MTKIYDQHNAAFRHVSAFVIMKEGRFIGKVAFKFPKDGAGNLYCYLHVLGLPMVRDFAGGYGYDKRSAAFKFAARKQAAVKLEKWQTSDYADEYAIAHEILTAVENRDGYDWDRNLKDAGFTIIQAV